MRGSHMVEECEAAGGLVPAAGADEGLAGRQLADDGSLQVLLIHVAGQAPLLSATEKRNLLISHFRSTGMLKKLCTALRYMFEWTQKLKTLFQKL